MASIRARLTGAALFALLVLSGPSAQGAGFSKALGPYGGFSQGPDQFFIGARAEFGRIVGPAVFSPSVDVGFGDNSMTTINADLKWYLLPLPDTGLYFYGAAGPTIVSSGGTEIGLSLAVGMHVPMRASNRYNIEVRFGLGDIPDVRFLAAVMFGFR